jgi:hypothetical protein
MSIIVSEFLINVPVSPDTNVYGAALLPTVHGKYSWLGFRFARPVML